MRALIRRRWPGSLPRSTLLVITVPAGVRIYLACGVTDMRKGFDGLSLMGTRPAKAAL